jgi:alpha-beta hydrolase superfamily lysophospholipase
LTAPFHQHRSHLPGPAGRIAVLSTFPSIQPACRLVYVHGFGEHKESINYRFFVAAMAGQGIETHGFDLPGHAGAGPFPSSWDMLRLSLATVVNALQPAAVVGISLGALIALEWSIHHQCARPLVTVGAPLAGLGLPSPVLAAAKILARAFPSLPLKPRLHLEDISRDQTLLRQYLADPLFHQRATAGALCGFLESVRAISRNAYRFQAPLLMLHGADDTIARPDFRFLEQSSAVCKRSILYPGARHNLFLETNREEVFANIAHFLLERRHPTSSASVEPLATSPPAA